MDAPTRQQARSQALDVMAKKLNAWDESKPQRTKGLESLAPLKRRRRETPPHLTVDIESKDGPTQRPGFTRPFLAGVFDGHRTKIFHNDEGAQKRPWQERHLASGGCIDQTMRYLLRKKYQGARIYAHNGGAFDFLFFIAWLAKEKRYKFELTSQGPNVLALRVELLRQAKRGKAKNKRDDKTAWTFVDSIRLLPMALKKAAKAFGCETQKLDFDLVTDEHDPRWAEYLRDDLKSLHECLERVGGLLEELGGEMALTAPSAALKLFQRQFLKEKIARNVHDPTCKDVYCAGCAHEWIRRSYKGGRVEPFVIGGRHEGLYYYDINSSYPAAMLYPMPTGVFTVIHDPKMPWEHYVDATETGEWVGFASAVVTIPEDCHIPPLPVHHPKTGKLVFPVGTFSGVWDLEELKLLRLVPGARVAGLLKVVMYPATAAFQTMVRTLYRFRDKSRKDFDEGLAALVKLILNALYGKFGQRPENVEILYLPDRTAPEGAVPVGGDPLTAMVWTLLTSKDSAHILPQIASHVTALGRVRLFHLLRATEERGGRVYYCDTDCVLCDVELPESSELGMVKREYPCPNLVGSFIRPKVYCLECGCQGPYGKTCKVFGKQRGKPVWKGIPKKDVRGAVLTVATWKDVAAGETIHFRRLQKFKTMARGGLATPSMVKTHKRLATAYDKRIVLPDGSTRPICLNEIAT